MTTSFSKLWQHTSWTWTWTFLWVFSLHSFPLGGGTLSDGIPWRDQTFQLASFPWPGKEEDYLLGVLVDQCKMAPMDGDATPKLLKWACLLGHAYCWSEGKILIKSTVELLSPLTYIMLISSVLSLFPFYCNFLVSPPFLTLCFPFHKMVLGCPSIFIVYDICIPFRAGALAPFTVYIMNICKFVSLNVRGPNVPEKMDHGT